MYQALSLLRLAHQIWPTSPEKHHALVVENETLTLVLILGDNFQYCRLDGALDLTKDPHVLINEIQELLDSCQP